MITSASKPTPRIRVEIDFGRVAPGSVLWHIIEAIKLGLPQLVTECVAHHAGASIVLAEVAVRTRYSTSSRQATRDFRIHTFLPSDMEDTAAGRAMDNELSGAVQRVMRTMRSFMPRTPYFLVETVFDASLPPLLSKAS